MIDKENFSIDIENIRQKSPLVHNITNYVAMNFTANALLSIGASPVMAHAEEEVAEMVSIADALVVNIGTLDKYWVKGMEKAAETANKLHIPWILDPVGSGATKYRTETALHLISTYHPNVIRGNASEIMSLNLDNIKSKGVDSSSSSNCALNSAKDISQKYNTIVAISGETDYVCFQNSVETIRNGSPLMTKVTAMGCTESSIIGAFLSVEKDFFKATTFAMALTALCGELAINDDCRLGYIQSNFINKLNNITLEEIIQNLRQ